MNSYIITPKREGLPTYVAISKDWISLLKLARTKGIRISPNTHNTIINNKDVKDSEGRSITTESILEV